MAFLEHLRETGVELFLHQQGLDTTTSSGRAMFGMLSVFAEFERSIIRERVLSGMARAKAKGTKSGKAIGRPVIAPPTRNAIRDAYKAGGVSLRAVARKHNVGVETVRRCLAEIEQAQAVIAPEDRREFISPRGKLGRARRGRLGRAIVSAGLLLSRQGPCGLPAVCAARSRPTPRRRSSANRVVPRFHCFQAMARSRRRVHWSRSRNIDGVSQKSK